MDKVPNEIEDLIIQYIFYNKCYLKNDDYNNLKRCTCISKKFNSLFKCKPIFFNKQTIEFCLIHDTILLKNINNIIQSIIDNLNDKFNYYVKIFITETSTILIPLSTLYLQPYIGIMNDNYYYHYIDIKIPKSVIISEVKERFIKKIFKILNINYNKNILGYNSEKLRNHVKVLNDFQIFLKINKI